MGRIRLIHLYWTWILFQKKQNDTVWWFLTETKFRTLILWEISTFQHFSNTAICKKSPNSCSQAAFLASSTRHSAKTQQKERLLTVSTHHVYKTCLLFLAGSLRGCATSSAFHFRRFSKGLGYSELAMSLRNHKSTMTRSSLVLCPASPRQHFEEHNVFILNTPLASAGPFLWHYGFKEVLTILCKRLMYSMCTWGACSGTTQESGAVIQVQWWTWQGTVF